MPKDPHDRSEQALAGPRAEPEGASERAQATEFGTLRHELRNVLTSLWHGCALVDAKVARGEHEEVRAFLDEMRACIDKGRSLVERLR